jgi:hypothetical protein
MKSGTTSLAFHLRHHPHVAMPRREVHFFDRDPNHERGVGWYERRLGAGVTPGTRVVGEKTPTYCYQPNVAARIHEAYPEVKLVWIFREPVARAHSNYLHAYRDGAIDMSFEEAVEREPELLKESIFNGYMERSRYWKQVERYLALFPREHMHFMLFEELVRDPSLELEGLFSFLGVAPGAFSFRDEPRGETTLPRARRLLALTHDLTGRGPLWRAVRYLTLVGRAPGYPALDPALRERFRKRFRDDNARLARLINRDLSAWDPDRPGVVTGGHAPQSGPDFQEPE